MSLHDTEDVCVVRHIALPGLDSTTWIIYVFEMVRSKNFEKKNSKFSSNLWSDRSCKLKLMRIRNKDLWIQSLVLITLFNVEKYSKKNMNNSTVIILFDVNYIIINKSSKCFDIAKIFLNILGNDANYSYS